jgi:hypothetical protein
MMLPKWSRPGFSTVGINFPMRRRVAVNQAPTMHYEIAENPFNSLRRSLFNSNGLWLRSGERVLKFSGPRMTWAAGPGSEGETAEKAGTRKKTKKKKKKEKEAKI